ncbi:MAG TPA: response regulator [Oligoflexus sp.]|uniref:hybrid sensor histidine kinase/response regulator n=1 Tax=Oligoflexus sp. TaxID=1971216 RepID=UPI002D80F650|nr:response regulator [Oligoflexus sp.]HET9240060.1 response regulator [Oligoflexus sp.]
MEALKILLVEDNDDHAAMIQRHLRKSLGNAFRCVHEGTLEGGLKRLDVDPIDVILLDLRLPDSAGVETLPQTFAKAPTIPIVILTSIEDRDLATRLISQGAQDFVSKAKLDGDTLCQILRNSVQRKRLEEELRIQTIKQQESQQLLQRMIVSLKENEERYRIVTEAASDAIFTFSGNGQILFANHAAETMFGYSREELAQKSINFLIPTALQSEGFDLLEMTRKDLEFQGLHRNGHAFPLEVSFGELTSEGQRTFTGIVRNITERKKIEEAWRRAKEGAEAANQAKSLFLANMSHEIRTPLNSIMGFMELLFDKTYSEEEKVQFAGAIRRNAQLLLQLIDDILDLSKVEAGKIDFERIPCSLSVLMRNIELLLEHKAKEKGIFLRIHSEEGVPDSITTDPTRLQQILINVISNAIKFTSRGGVSVKLMGKALPESREYLLEILVQDTGRGIPKENREHLFKPFSQADSSTTRKYGGTGLGLILSRRLAVALGGNVELVQSEPNCGSTFSIAIKTHSVKGAFKARDTLEPDLARRESLSEESKFWGLNVLIVDDSPDNQILLSQIMGQYGTQVTVAENGEEAIREALSKPFDIVFMDLQMPVKDGFTATRELRSRGYTTPILAISAAAMKEDREHALKAGCNDHLTKPINIHNLVKTVALHINKNSK